MRESTTRALRVQAPAAPADLDVRVGGPLWECIPPGEYDAAGVNFRRLKIFQTLKLAVEFDVIVPDQAADVGHRLVRCCRFYNLRRGPENRVIASPRGDYLREWTLVMNRRPSRHDRMSPRAFIGVLCRVEIATVTTNHRQQLLAELVQYSKVARIIERLAGSAAL